MPKKLTSQRPLLSLQNYFSNDLTDQTDQYIFVMKTDDKRFYETMSQIIVLKLLKNHCMILSEM